MSDIHHPSPSPAALPATPPQVRAAGVEEGEDRALRSMLRQLDGRRAAAERCRLVSVGLNGDGGGGIAEALREVQLQVKQLLSQEERLAAQAAAEREEEAAEARRGGGGAAAGDTSGGEHAATGGEEGTVEDEGEGVPAHMLQSAVALLDQAQLLLDDAEEQARSVCWALDAFFVLGSGGPSRVCRAAGGFQGS